MLMARQGYILCILLIALPLITLYLFKKIKSFVNKRNYIIMEIKRSDGRELRYWKRELKKLYISIIPVFGTMYLMFRRK